MPQLVGNPYDPDGSPDTSGNTGGSGGGDYLSALINIGGMVWNNYQQKKMMEQQNEWNRQNALDAYNRDLEQWNRQNEYNSPAMQRQRWAEAGMNPNLAYGGATGGNASSSPSARVPEVQGVPGLLSNLPGAMEMLSQYQNLKLGHAQIDNVKAQTDNIQSRTYNEALRGNLMSIQGDTLKNRTNIEYRKLSYQEMLAAQRYSQGEEMFPVKLRHEKFAGMRERSLFPYELAAQPYELQQSKLGVQKSLRNIGLMDQQQQLNVLRAHAMRNNLTEQAMRRESIVSDQILKSYQAQYQRGKSGSQQKENDSGVIMAIVRALTGMF